MTLPRLAAALALGLALLTGPAAAVQPDEMLSDPKLEARARGLSGELRCLVCQNQSIDDSDAPLAKDLRLLVRDRIEKGDSDTQVLDYLVARYGEFVLLRPRFNAQTAILWTLPFAVLILGAAGIFVALRRRSARTGAVEAPLTAEEKARLDEILTREG
ncbi:MAG: cytochrome c-type biogenesis protein CcmH [Siculibacillus sp.]|nr:cytochrome c-type biogenesis protein CcmH [Siculibacillus sp.]